MMEGYWTVLSTMKIIAFGVLAWALAVMSSVGAESLRPHVIFVLVDNLGNGDMKCFLHGLV